MVRERRAGSPGAGEEEADRLLLDERRRWVLLLRREQERLSARDEKGQVRARGEQPAELRRRADHLLEVVEEEEHPPVGDVRSKLAARPNRRGDRRHDELGVSDAPEADPPDPVLLRLDHFRRRLDGDPGLTGAGGAGQRQQADISAPQQAHHLG